MSDPHDTGREIRGRAQGVKVDALTRALEALDPDLVEWTDSFVFGRVWARPGLEFEERMLVAITALAAQGQIPQLRNYLHAALQASIPEAMVQDALSMICVYAGFPCGINALECWREVREAHNRAAASATRTPGGENAWRVGWFPHSYYHVGVLVSDLDAAMSELGAALKLTFNLPHESSYGEDRIRVSYCHQGPPYLELIESRVGTRWQAVGGPRPDHVGYFTSDLERDAATLQDGGLPIAIDGREYGTHFTYHRSPSTGMRIELVGPELHERVMGLIHGR